MDIEGNPFRKEGRIEEAIEAQAAEDAKTAEEAQESEEAPAEPEADEADEIFADDEPEGDDGAEDEEDDLFEDKPADEDKGEDKGEDKPKPKTVPLSRLNKVISQREEARGQVASLEKKVAELNGKVSALEGLSKEFQERYTQNPDLLAYDHDFMEAMENLSKSDPSVAKIAAQIDGYIKTGRKPTVEKPAEKQESAAPKADSLTQKVLERDVRRTIVDNLTEKGFKQNYARLVADDMILEKGLESLIDVDDDAVKSHARKFVKAKGFTRDEVLKNTKKAAEASGKKKPPTGGNEKPASSAKSSEEPGKQKPRFKTIEELKADRDARFSNFARELGM